MPLRHTAEHVLHTAMRELYPNIKLVMGPPIEEGFYFDFDLDENISPEDFQRIEAKMKEIVDAGLDVKMKEVTEEEARKTFKNNEYKQNTIDEIIERGEKITVCVMGDETNPRDVDLCMGYHVENTSKVKAFKLLSMAGAYYKGDENNKMLQRIYGTAFFSKEDLDKHIEELERRRENDHRKLNNDLDIFATSDLVGKGFVMYTPNGTIIRNELRNHLLDVCKKFGAKEVNIPHIAKIDLYEKSGHAEKFKDELFKVISHYDEEFVLKPVNCPHHTQIYASRPRSYRDLPIAYVESTQQHRDEKPGAIGGLNRARSFEIDDGHTFCTPEQVKGEVMNLINVMREFYESLGMWGDHWVSLSFRDPETPEKFIGTDDDWNRAEALLTEINNEMNLDGEVMIGEAALYGPKIDVMLKDALGNDRQLGTVQVDFSMPARFGLTYTDKDGSEKTPVMIHRAILGSYHRFISYLMESTGGAFPVWLAPNQITIIPIGESHVDYAQDIHKTLTQAGLRSEVNNKDITLGAKIREAQNIKIPYMIIVGDKEVESNKISIRLRSGEQINGISLDEFKDKALDIYLTRSLKLW